MYNKNELIRYLERLLELITAEYLKSIGTEREKDMIVVYNLSTEILSMCRQKKFHPLKDFLIGFGLALQKGLGDESAERIVELIEKILQSIQ